MGYIQHHAIVVTCYGRSNITELAEFAHLIGAIVLGPQRERDECNTENLPPPALNDFQTICIAPDGSKEGWEESDEGDKIRQRIKEWLRANKDRRTGYDWCEITYSDEFGKAEIVDHNCGAE